MNGNDDVEAVAALLNDVFHEPKFSGPAYLSWLYRKNPAGNEVATNRFDGTECVAHYIVVPDTYSSATTPVPLKMALSLNTAVSPKARMKGLFVQLAEETFRCALDRGTAAVTGVANENSPHGFVARLQFRLVTPLPVTIGVSSMLAR